MKRSNVAAVTALLFLFSNSPLFANAAALNSRCTAKQWYAGSKVKIGKVTAQCIAGPDDYYWIDVRQVSRDAAKAGPLEKAQMAPAAKPVLQVAIVPSVIGLSRSQAMSMIQRAGLIGVGVYGSQGGQAGAACSMANAGVVISQSPSSGSRVKKKSQVQFLTSC